MAQASTQPAAPCVGPLDLGPQVCDDPDVATVSAPNSESKVRTHALALTIALFTLACGSKRSEPVALSRVELPVVSIGLPPGDMNDTAAKNANAGQLVLVNAAERGGVLILGWDIAEAFTDEEVAMMGRALSKELGEARVTPGPTRTVAGVEARTLIMDLGKRAPGRMTVWRCGERNVFLATFFRSEELASLDDRILETAVCREAAVAAPLVPQLALPPGWGRLPGTQDATFTNAAGAFVLIKESPSLGVEPSNRETKTRVLLRSFLEASRSTEPSDDIVFTPLVVEGEERLIGRAQVVLEGLPLTFRVVIATCPDLDTHFYVVATSSGESAGDTSLDSFFRARCPASRDAPAPTFPEAVPVFEAACTRGDLASCVRLAELSEDTDYPSLVDADRAARSRKRACELGGPEYCAGSPTEPSP